MNSGCKGNEKISYQQEIIHKNLVLGLRDVIISHFEAKNLADWKKCCNFAGE